MKKITLIASLAALSCVLSVNIANAAVPQKAQDPCSFEKEVLHTAQFPVTADTTTPYAIPGTYSGQYVLNLLGKLDINTSKIKSIDPGVQYKLTYDCQMKDKLGNSKLYAAPVNLTALGQPLPVSIISWHPNALTHS